jgi:hypothetical protein
MNINIEQLLAIIGGKEVDLFLLRNENAELRKRLSEAEAKLAEKPEAPR